VRSDLLRVRYGMSEPRQPSRALSDMRRVLPKMRGAVPDTSSRAARESLAVRRF
jgi:hypothetical protein